jgi:hypothetical protein
MDVSHEAGIGKQVNGGLTVQKDKVGINWSAVGFLGEDSSHGVGCRRHKEIIILSEDQDALVIA